MVPIDRDIVTVRIEHIRENLRHLRECGKMKKREFEDDFKMVSAVERMLQTSIEAMLDIGSHIIAAEGLAAPEDYKDIFTILGKNNILSKSLTAKCVEMAKFRNVIVHGYMGVDTARIYEILRSNLDDFDLFIKAILKRI